MAIVTDTPPGASPLTPTAVQPAARLPQSLATGPKGPDNTLFGADGLTFRDLLDMINPLQHLPVVSSIYRAVTQDELSAGSRLIGGGLFGGFIGLGVAMFNTVIEDLTGRDLGDHVIAMFKGNGDDAPGVDGTPEVMVAALIPVPENLAAPTAAPPPTATLSNAPSKEPQPLPPPAIAAVTRQPLAPPPGLMATPDPVANSLAAPGMAAGQTQPAERPYRPAYLMNTDLIDILMYSVPVEVGPGTAHQDRTSQLGDTPGTPAAAQTAGHRAYQLGLAIRSAATGSSAFTLLGANEQI